MWIEFGVVFSVFLAHRFVLVPQLFSTKKYIKYIVAVAVLITGVCLFILLDGVNETLSLWGDSVVDHLRPSVGDTPPPRMNMLPLNTPPRISPQSIIPPGVSVVIFSMVVIALDLGLDIAAKWIISEHKQAEMSKERVSTQLTNLQNQISPHFFMNTLNNIHALVEIDPKRAQRTIIELSELMDYLLYESSNLDNISLHRELEFTRNYINLMRLRYPKRVLIEFSHEDPIPSIKIPPLLFLNFIENTFKYGVDYSKDSFIKICFIFDPTYIEMTTINSNHSAIVKSEKRHGLGIDNGRKRLKLLYGSRYSLNIDNRDDIFCVTLRIPTQ